MNKKLTLIVFIGIWSFVASAYVPSIDSLFKNANNIDVSESTVVASLMLTKETTISNVEGEEISTEPQRSAHKLLLTSEESGLSDLLQVDYRNGLISFETINEVKRINKLTLKTLESELFETKLFYSLLKSLLINKSDLMISFLNSIDSKIVSNNEIVDKEQLELLNRYKYYLQQVAEENEEAQNPLLSEDPDKRKEIKEILSRNLVGSDGLIKRVFRNKKFYLEYTSDVVKVIFDNENHQMQSLTIKNGESETKIEMLKYVLFSGGFEFPEEINITLANGDQFKISMKKLQLIKDTKESYYRRIKSYQKQIKAVEDKIIVINKPMFVL